ncbi:MAG: hypothetical protein AB1847_15935 [bacterium]
MRKNSKPLILAALLVLFLYHRSHAENWEKVADKGFGDPGNDYAWSMETFRGKLYVGTLNSMKGAQIWRSGTGGSRGWERVYHASTVSNSGIRCLYRDGDRALYAGTFNSLGGQILRTANGKTWVCVGRSGLEDARNTSIRCIVRFGEYLYAGTGSSGAQSGQSTVLPQKPYGAQIYRSRNGFVWELVETEPDFRSTRVFDPQKSAWVTNNISIGELEVFNGMLYAFTWTQDVTVQTEAGLLNISESMIPQMNGAPFPDPPGAFEVWRSRDGVKWEKVVGLDDSYGNGMGFNLKDPDPDAMKNNVAMSGAVYQGKLYLGTENTTGKTAVWRTADGTQWEKVLDFHTLKESSNFYVWRMMSFKDRLFVGTMNMGNTEDPGVTGGQIWVSRSGDADTFYNLVHNGFDGKTVPFGDIHMPKNYGIRVFGILNDTLFAGTATILSFPAPQPARPWAITIAGKDVGCEVWKLISAADSSDSGQRSTEGSELF